MSTDESDHIRLYECPPTRSQRAKWVLEELSLNYESHKINLGNMSADSEAYRSLHPLCAVPVLETENYRIFESVAIVLQLIDEHREIGLAPAIGTPERAIYYQWSVFACSELDPALMTFFNNSIRPHEFGGEDNPSQAKKGCDEFERRAQIISSALVDQDYLLGSSFSGADILIGHSCFMADLMGLLSDFPILQDYLKRLQDRPAYKRAYVI